MLSYLNSNFELTLGYLNPALNNSALRVKVERKRGLSIFFQEFKHKRCIHLGHLGFRGNWIVLLQKKKKLIIVILIPQKPFP